MAVRVTDLSNTSRPREATSLPDNCSFSRGFFLLSLGKNEAHSSTQERPLKPARGSARRACPPSHGGARSSAPRRLAGGRGALSSPRFVLPTSTDLLKFENGSRVSLGYSLHLERETQRGQHKKASLPCPLPPPPTPASTNSRKEASGCEVTLPLLGTLPYPSFLTIRLAFIFFLSFSFFLFFNENNEVLPPSLSLSKLEQFIHSAGKAGNVLVQGRFAPGFRSSVELEL